MIWSISSQAISVQTKIDVMQCAIARCLKVYIMCKGIQAPFVLDSDTGVTLIRGSYFNANSELPSQ